MEYQSVNEIKKVHNIEEIIFYSKGLWYSLTEKIETIPSSEQHFKNMLFNYEKIFFDGWKIIMERDYSFILKKGIETGKLIIEMPRSGKVSFKILPDD